MSYAYTDHVYKLMIQVANNEQRRFQFHDQANFIFLSAYARHSAVGLASVSICRTDVVSDALQQMANCQMQ